MIKLLRIAKVLVRVLHGWGLILCESVTEIFIDIIGPNIVKLPFTTIGLLVCHLHIFEAITQPIEPYIEKFGEKCQVDLNA